VRFRLWHHGSFMSNVEYIPIRTSGNAVVLGVIVLGPWQRLCRFLKKP
jgi:hypothetical protein